MGDGLLGHLKDGLNEVKKTKDWAKDAKDAMGKLPMSSDTSYPTTDGKSAVFKKGEIPEAADKELKRLKGEGKEIKVDTGSGEWVINSNTTTNGIRVQDEVGRVGMKDPKLAEKLQGIK